MGSFRIAFDITGGIEGRGAWSNKASDRGGETYCGLSRVMNPKWQGWIRIDELKNKPGFPNNLKYDGLLNDMVIKFFKANYWDVNNLDMVNNQMICNEIYDTGVNMGVEVAGRFMQTVLNVSNLTGKYYPDLKIDGQLGPVSVAAINKHPYPMVLLKAFNCLQGEKYIEICLRDPSQEINFRGWMTRVFEYEKAA